MREVHTGPVDLGGQWLRRSRGELERWGSASTAVALAAYGLSRRSVPGIFVAAAALPFAYRGVSGRWPSPSQPWRKAAKDTRVALAGRRGIHVRESIRLEQPLADVYRFWRRFENLPTFMANLERVTELGHRRSHWIAKGPRDMKVEWDAEIINEIENKVIGWRSLPGGDIATAGSVTFREARAGRSTEVSVHLQYAPPAGRAGALAAWLAGREPNQTIREDLRRLKQLLEAGEIPVGGSPGAPEINHPKEARP
jgi:uncharacterized membrane protein